MFCRTVCREMKCSEITLFVFILAKATASNECPPNAEKLPCDSLRSSGGFRYSLPANIPCSGNTHCEEGWYYENGTFIVDPNKSERRLPIAITVTSESLTVKDCVNLQWQLECEKCNCVINYTVTVSQAQGGDSNGLPGWGIALMVVVGGVAAAAAAAACIVWYRNTRRSTENGVV